ncbi:RNA 2',3'-cyclic phosphodiesterase [Stenotrophomonas sp. HITSZ_GD]|uniref:RNA 2',3'-cyclic phosphodiesterase n=1 Tax=Stenotrophomonas sp. HITSZ_GD TaxID=3037248 RepID=UPI00240CE909|nr:RNA 2',3'-cyclic phosphodiesterase [Stenotrophomonas sp. HITSZ_GD]MDG2527016.1 RNA 2',3'-cyclic phosphodiesterase [Stenotrophomonas sp. HITSZ_GD]
MNRQFLYLSSAEAQLSLGFGEARATERLFFALLPPAAVAEAAHAVAAALRVELPSARLIARERLHVTLHYLGEYAGLPPSLLARAQRAAQALRMAPFALALDRVGSFGGPRRERPGVALGDAAGTAGAHELHRRLASALAHEGLSGDTRFTPHMTLLYDRHGIAERPLATPLAWEANELVLLRSVRGQAHYREEGRWPLAG